MTVEGARQAHEQLDLLRRLVTGGLSVSEFDEPFLRARNAGIDAGGSDDLVLLDLLDDVWFAIDMHNEYDDLREPDEFDDAQLLEVLTRYLADWDAGTWQPDPRWAR
jgi:hypothetical protein